MRHRVSPTAITNWRTLWLLRPTAVSKWYRGKNAPPRAVYEVAKALLDELTPAEPITFTEPKAKAPEAKEPEAEEPEATEPEAKEPEPEPGTFDYLVSVPWEKAAKFEVVAKMVGAKVLSLDD
jgi:hypothetical protein